MDMIRINDQKLKITLSSEDVRDYLPGIRTGMNDSAEQPDRDEARRLLRRLLEQAGESAGFDTTGSRVYIQYFPAHEGGGELFVTKIGTCPDCANENVSLPERVCTVPIRSLPEPRTHTSRLTGSEHCGRTLVFRFSALEELLAVCRRLHCRTSACESDAWRDEDALFYLFLYDPRTTGTDGVDGLTFILEYGEPANAEHTRLFLCEHGQMLCRGNAVETLARF